MSFRIIFVKGRVFSSYTECMYSFITRVDTLQYLSIMLSMSLPRERVQTTFNQCKNLDVDIQQFLESLPSQTRAIIDEQ